jgi:hypothetical protein
MITSYQEAQCLYSMCEAERREREIALQITQAELQQAKEKFQCARKKFQYARKKLTNAEFRLGRTRFLIKKDGFSNILGQKSCLRRRPVVKVYRMYIPSYFI